MQPSKRFLITVGVLLILPTLNASQVGDDGSDLDTNIVVDDRHSAPVLQDPQQPPRQTPVNLNEDVPGCVDDYLRCISGCWIIAEGWFDFGATLGTVATTFLGGLATLGDLSAETRVSLGIAAVVTGSVSTAFLTLKQFASKAIIERKRRLEQVIREAHNQV